MLRSANAAAASAGLTLVFAGLALAQTPLFEAASVKPPPRDALRRRPRHV